MKSKFYAKNVCDKEVKPATLKYYEKLVIIVNYNVNTLKACFKCSTCAKRKWQ